MRPVLGSRRRRTRLSQRRQALQQRRRRQGDLFSAEFSPQTVSRPGAEAGHIGRTVIPMSSLSCRRKTCRGVCVPTASGAGRGTVGGYALWRLPLYRKPSWLGAVPCAGFAQVPQRLVEQRRQRNGTFAPVVRRRWSWPHQPWSIRCVSPPQTTGHRQRPCLGQIHGCASIAVSSFSAIWRSVTLAFQLYKATSCASSSTDAPLRLSSEDVAAQRPS